MELSTDTQELVVEARRGAQPAFERLFDRHRARLSSIVKLRLDPRLSSRLDPSDIVQETYLEALRRLDSYLAEPSMSFFLWIRWIAQEKVLQAHRKHLFSEKRTVVKEQVRLDDSDSAQFLKAVAAPDPTPTRELSNRELASMLERAISALPEQDRSVIVWRHFEGLSVEETAELLQIGRAAAGKRYVRALEKLRRELGQQGFWHD